jgi:uncharacterized protein (TIGR01777 family)
VVWNPATGDVPAGALEGFDAVVHLAADNIADGRWTSAKKRRLVESRTVGTRHLATALGRLSHPPKVLLSASAVGFYGNRGNDVLDENAGVGRGFLPDLCRRWEAATEPASAAGIRVCHLRLGAVLDPSGGALGKMKIPFQLGVGGPLGRGHQWFSWIAIDDVVGAVRHLIKEPELSGAVNLVGPNPVTNAEFAKTLGRVLRRPAIVPLPRAVARIALGEVVDAVLYASLRVRPEALLATGYAFQYPELEPALRHLLGK